MTDPQRRLNVVHLVTTLNVGGLEMVVLNLARLTNRDRFRLRVVCWGESGVLGPRFESLGIPVYSLAAIAPSLPCRFWLLVRMLWRLRPDILHTHNPSPHLLGALAGLVRRIPVFVHTKHGRNFPDRFLTVWLNRLAALRTHYVVAVSRDAADLARDVEKVPARKVRVIHNGVDLESFPAGAERDSGCHLRGIHVARLTPVKDQGTLLRAVRLVCNAEPRFRLDVVGDGPSRGELETLRDELGLEGRVRFLGYREEVATLLRGAGLFLLSSLSEGVSLTLLEAMACSLPIVATDVGGNREVVADGATGLLVPARSPEQFAEAVLSLLRAPGRADEMARAARLKVEREFDLRKMVSDYEDLYLSTLASAG
jgi:sugar transferase (PEP-CTERM/EpsH1 system associated)